MVDVVTAKHHGVCPICEGYGGHEHPCAGCRDGDVLIPEPPSGMRIGSWEAYEFLHPQPCREEEMSKFQYRIYSRGMFSGVWGEWVQWTGTMDEGEYASEQLAWLSDANPGREFKLVVRSVGEWEDLIAPQPSREDE